MNASIDQTPVRISPEEFDRQLKKMDKRIGDAKRNAKQLPTLVEKREADRTIKNWQAERDQFALSFFEITVR